MVLSMCLLVWKEANFRSRFLGNIDAVLTDIIVPDNSGAAGKMIRDLNIPEKWLIMFISKNDKFVIPAESIVIHGGDVLLGLANMEYFSVLQQARAR